jgi:hypothetical protein
LDYEQLELGEGLHNNITIALPQNADPDIKDNRIRGFCLYRNKMTQEKIFEYTKADDVAQMSYPPLIFILTSFGEIGKYGLIDKRDMYAESNLLIDTNPPEALTRSLSSSPNQPSNVQVQPDKQLVSRTISNQPFKTDDSKKAEEVRSIAIAKTNDPSQKKALEVDPNAIVKAIGVYEVESYRREENYKKLDKKFQKTNNQLSRVHEVLKNKVASSTVNLEDEDAQNFRGWSYNSRKFINTMKIDIMKCRNNQQNMWSKIDHLENQVNQIKDYCSSLNYKIDNYTSAVSYHSIPLYL